MSIRFLALCVALGLALGAPVRAEEEDAEEEAEEADYTRPGLYVGLAGLYAIENFNRGSVTFGNTGGLNARIGYRGDEYISEEIEFAWKSGYPSDEGDNEIVQYDITLNFKWYVPFERWQPYLLTGLGAMISRQNGDDFHSGSSPEDTAFLAKFGLGLEAYVTEHIAGNVGFDWNLPVSSGHSGGDQFISFTFGLLYRF